jgi:LL-diaminopimelate aminotransferase
MEPAKRLNRIPTHPFAVLEQRIQRQRAKGADVIRLDIGSPDMPPAAFIVDRLKTSADDPTKHSYAGFYGIPALRQAMADYYQRRFGVALEVDTEIMPLLGSKEGIVHLQTAWLDPGEVGLVPDPAYPTYAMGACLANAHLEPFPLLPERGWLPDLEAIPEALARRARLLWLNYPNNPTGAVTDLAFFEAAVAFCRRYEILLCHDGPYCDVTYDGYVAPSPLQVPGAKEVVLEFNSLSKTYNLAGWRIGMAVGNRAAVQALARVKTQVDSGLALPIQEMAVAAFKGDQAWVAARNRVYRDRRDMVVAALRTMGIEVTPPRASLYVWFPVPKGYTSDSLHDYFLEKADVSISPGTFYGAQGAGWMRLSLGVATARLEEALARLRALPL